MHLFSQSMTFYAKSYKRQWSVEATSGALSGRNDIVSCWSYGQNVQRGGCAGSGADVGSMGRFRGIWQLCHDGLKAILLQLARTAQILPLTCLIPAPRWAQVSFISGKRLSSLMAGQLKCSRWKISTCVYLGLPFIPGTSACVRLPSLTVSLAHN